MAAAAAAARAAFYRGTMDNYTGTPSLSLSAWRSAVSSSTLYARHVSSAASLEILSRLAGQAGGEHINFRSFSPSSPSDLFAGRRANARPLPRRNSPASLKRIRADPCSKAARSPGARIECCSIRWHGGLAGSRAAEKKKKQLARGPLPRRAMMMLNGARAPVRRSHPTGIHRPQKKKRMEKANSAASRQQGKFGRARGGTISITSERSWAGGRAVRGHIVPKSAEGDTACLLA